MSVGPFSVHVSDTPSEPKHSLLSFKKYFFIYLPALGLSCSSQDL